MKVKLVWWLGLVCAFFSVQPWAAPQDTPPFYQVEYQGERAYLLGTIHVGKADFYPFANQIEASLRHSKSLVLEADVSEVNASALLREYGFTPLKMDRVTEKAMAKYCQPRMQLCTALKPYSPWLQAVQLEMMQFSALGYKPQWGVETTLVSRLQGKPIYELESMEFQFKMLASFDEAVQWSMLRDTIKAKDEELEDMVTAWRTGDQNRMQAMLEEQMVTDEQQRLTDQLIFKRNAGMAERIQQLFKAPKTEHPMFIAVGSLHLVGDKSVQAFLRKQGMKLTDCWQAQCQFQ